MGPAVGNIEARVGVRVCDARRLEFGYGERWRRGGDDWAAVHGGPGDEREDGGERVGNRRGAGRRRADEGWDFEGVGSSFGN